MEALPSCSCTKGACVLGHSATGETEGFFTAQPGSSCLRSLLRTYIGQNEHVNLAEWRGDEEVKMVFQIQTVLFLKLENEISENSSDRRV